MKTISIPKETLKAPIRKIAKKFRWFLNIQFLFMPNYWVALGEVDHDWDERFNALMDLYEFQPIEKPFSKYFAKIGNTIVWIKNHPYKSFEEGHFTEGGLPNVRLSGGLRPTRLTVKRAYKKLQQDKKNWANLS